jgi:hypothetical protein
MISTAARGREPTHPALIDDLDQGHYFHGRAAAPA